jgi:hypothetical protein
MEFKEAQLMSNEVQNDRDPWLPEPNAAETVRVMICGSSDRNSWWRRLLPPSLVSIGSHLFLLPFLLVITVTFADSFVGVSSWSVRRTGE